MSTHVVVVGESLVDVLVTPAGTEQRPGGSCLNVAVALSRLQVPVTLVTSYGDDEGGRLLDRHLAGVDVRRVAAPTSRAVAEIDASGHARYLFELTWDLGDVPLPRAGHLHVGSLGAVVEPGCSTVRRMVDEHEGTVSLDPNWRPGLTSPAALSRVEALVARADVVKLSDEDAEAMYPGRPLEDLVLDWLDRGPEWVVVTRGAHGAVGWSLQERVQVDSPAGGPVVDTVGAGDAFMAGLLRSWLEDHELDAALDLASRVARVTCERQGAQPPFLAELGATA